MIGEVNKALNAFWNSFGVPAYLTGHVPDDAQFPFITFDAASSDAFSTAILTAFDWHKAVSGDNKINERAELMDDIAEAIPPQGRRIALTHGYIILYRNSADFQTYYDDQTDKSVIGGRTSYDDQMDLSVIGGRTSVECRYQTI